MHRLPLFFVPGHDPLQAHLMKPGEYLVAVDGIAVEKQAGRHVGHYQRDYFHL